MLRLSRIEYKLTFTEQTFSYPFIASKFSEGLRLQAIAHAVWIKKKGTNQMVDPFL